MSSTKKLSIIYLISLFALGLWAAWHYRIEMVDGSQALFHLMNNMPYENYINHRRLGQFIQYSAFFNSFLIEMGLSFKTIYLLHNIAIALNPFLICLLTLWFLIKNNKEKLIVYYLISFSMSILMTYSFHISLVPESILFGWLAYFCWRYSHSLSAFVLGIPSAIFLNLGYESSCIFSLVIIFGTLYLAVTKKISNESVRSSLLKVLMSLLCLITIIYRLYYFEHFGFLKYSATESVSSHFPAFYFMITAFIAIILFKVKKINNKFIHFLLILSNIVIFYYFSDSHLNVFSGYNLRTIAIAPAFIIFLFMLVDRQDKTSKNLEILCFVLLVTFGIHDILLTKYWHQYRVERLAKLDQYKSGCYTLDHSDWEMPYFSLNSQQTFKPNFIVIDNTDDSRCEQVMGEYQLIPKIYLYEKVKNYDFSLLFLK